MRILKTLCLALLAGIVSHTATADIYPSKPVRIVIPYAAGGGADALARQLGLALGKELGQPFIIDSKPGANTAIAATFVAKAPADGYTLLLTGNATTALNPLILERMPYDPDKDFAPISMVTRSPVLVIASAELGVNSLAELLELVRARPGTLAYASNGTGGLIHLGMELLTQEAKIKLNHVPYKGFAPALPDVVSGRTPISMFDLGSLGSYAKVGKIKVLASTSATRSKLFPEVPTVAELGFPGFQVESWFTLYAPANTPQAIIDVLNEQVRKWTALPETVQSLALVGQEPESSTSAYVRTRIQRERQTYAPLVKAANIKAE